MRTNLTLTAVAGVLAALVLTAARHDSLISLVRLRTQQAPIPGIDVDNSGYPIERSACLTIAIGPAAAAECGNLRVVHPLPSVRTLNKIRTPTLLYNSEFAHPYFIAPVQVKLTSTTTTPDSVEVVLYLNINGSNVERARRRWAGSEWPASQTTTRRVTIACDCVNDTTGYYVYNVEVANLYPGGVRLAAALVGGKGFLLNRKTSYFGAGWWLAGLERLLNQTPTAAEIAWFGGDGSARFFVKHGTLPNTWYTPVYERSDTLYYDPGTLTWTKTDVEGVRTKFNSSGRHIQTIDRFGRTTTFTYSVDTLKTITLPPNNLTYQFAYTSGRLASVTAPPIGAITRVTQVSNVNGNVTAIRNPGDSAVTFGYETASSDQYRMDKRTNRRGVIDTFTVDSARRVTSSRIKMGGGATPDIIWALVPGETRGVPKSGTPSSVDTARVFTKIDGPRTDVVDTSAIYQSRFGPPRRIIDALSNEIRVLSGPYFFGTVFGWHPLRAQYPNGRVLLAEYDNDQIGSFGGVGRGNLIRLIDSVTAVAGQRDTTRYEWDGKFDQITKTVPPEKDSTVFSVSSTNGRRQWQQDARGLTSRITFAYDGSNPEQMTSMTLPTVGGQLAVYSYTYGSGLRNLASEQTPKGFTTAYVVDGIGRITKITTPIDSTASSTRKVEHYLFFDLLDRVSRDSTATLNVTPSEKVWVETFYNAEGQPDSLRRSMDPDPASIGTITNRWRYDAADRTLAAVAPDAKVDSTEYDAAGNAVKLITRRNTPGDTTSAQPIVIAYDALNRLSSRTTPGYTYDSLSNVGILSWIPSPIAHPLYQIPTDTATFTYNSDSQIRTAVNGSSKVIREYHVTGLLKEETLKIWPVTGTDSTKHVYLTQMRYDRDGRRKSLKVPSQLVPSGKDSIRYAYTSWGALEHVYDLYQNDLVYAYNDRSEPTQLTLGSASVVHKWSYDSDGRVVTDTITNGGGTTFPRYGLSPIRSVRAWYDGRDKILKKLDAAGFKDTVLNTYSGLGNVTGSHLIQNATAYPLGIAARYAAHDTLTYDPLGNIRLQTTTDSTKFGTNPPDVTGTGRIVSYKHNLGRDSTDAWTHGARTSSFDASGNLYFASLFGSFTYPSDDRVSYYDAGEQLRAVSRLSVAHSGVDQGFQRKTTFEEYRYDALGRRIWVRGVRTCDVDTNNPLECTISFVRRTVWDGNQELAEIQAPGAETQDTVWERDTGYVHLSRVQWGDGDPNRYYGRVVYTHGLAVDQPISVARFAYADYPFNGSYTPWNPIVVFPLWNMEGRPTLGIFSTGNGYQQYQTGGTACPDPPGTNPNRCLPFYWPLGWSAYDQQKGIPMPSWHGTLLEDKQDHAGTYYRRSRAYEPQSGRFTQEDPIGLAGGLNLYGFANGDPVNFSDPFGLRTCAEKATTLCDAWDAFKKWASEAGGRIVGGLALLHEALNPMVDVMASLVGHDPTTGEKISGGDRAVLAASAALGGFFLARPGGRGRLTNAQARDFAGWLGFTEVKGARSSGQLVFTNGVAFISPDITSHTGGVWKLLNRNLQRIGTLDAMLQYFGK